MKEYKYPEVSCELSGNISELSKSHNERQIRIAELRASRKLIDSELALLSRQDMKFFGKRKVLRGKVSDALANMSTDISHFNDMISDIEHYVELYQTTPEEDTRLIEALKYARRSRRIVLDRRALLSSAYYEMTGKAPRESLNMNYDEHMVRINSKREYTPKAIPLEDILSDNYIKEESK